MRYAGKNVRRSAARRAPVSERAAEERASREAARLLAALLLLIAAMATKLVYPAAGERLAGAIGGSVDYKAAVMTLGEAVGGERDLKSAVSEAIARAFKAAPEETVPALSQEAAGDGEIDLEPTAEEGTPVIAEPETVTHETPGEEAADDTGEAAVAAFKARQESYGLDMPNGVSYDKPELGIELTVPVMGEVSSPFGYRYHPVDSVVKFHYGVDIAAPMGDEVRAAQSGTVEAVADSTSFGRYVLISHAEGVKTLYAHLDSVSVKTGDSVDAGDAIGTVGMSGNATGCCTHFELTKDGEYLNPEYYLDWQ